ncbi:hypothetical protein PSECIP111951_03062 [Pseudoalteromonas holothuriae]|uniref:Secreted protein n=1 Tax=Pseudoalteromonas holothuriae TaxID=2963714 RepID=A0A9W4QZ88_9GAMM|nr:MULTISPECIES: hypothetical protein [unclassified Pseudoalteromonas]CAH9059686.1 hypothetical protein PSECIP111854_02456 [Pseudoalteromonas sp. CIP111854]CAH9064158.1 hypothetical protein PSECIP111951_03062 [Pseudoalteromonas sp. CIP111951]
MKNSYNLQALFATFCLVFSSMSIADFDLPGEGTLRYPTGVEKDFKFGFGWQASTQQFRIGDKSYEMSELPESYSIAITLSKDGTKIWVQEFNKGFIEGFEWQLGKHKLSLKKQDLNNNVLGNYLLTFNKRDYFLARPNVSVEVSFNQDGIDRVKLDGVTKDMGIKN